MARKGLIRECLFARVKGRLAQMPHLPFVTPSNQPSSPADQHLDLSAFASRSRVAIQKAQQWAEAAHFTALDFDPHSSDLDTY